MPKKTLDDGLLGNIQLLRAFAALAVVFLHTTSTAGLTLPVSVGHFGVDIFFVISGFIIPYISTAKPAQFMLKRIIRLVPAYWTTTIGVFLIAFFWPHLLHNTRADPVLLICSLFFVPHDHETPHAVPLLIAGWTLNYEMYFYVLFAAGLAVAKKHATLICTALVLLVLLLTRTLMDADSYTAATYYGQPIVVEFVFGICIFEAYRRLPWITVPAHRRDAGFYATLAVAATAFVFLPLEEYLWDAEPQLLLLGGPSAVLVLSSIILERRYGLFSRNKMVLIFGEASYVLYLIHPYVIYGAMRVLFRGATHWPQPLQWLFAIFLLVFASLAAILIHLYFEKPVMKFLRWRFLNASEPVIFKPSDSITN